MVNERIINISYFISRWIINKTMGISIENFQRIKNGIIDIASLERSELEGLAIKAFAKDIGKNSYRKRERNLKELTGIDTVIELLSPSTPIHSLFEAKESQVVYLVWRFHDKRIPISDISKILVDSIQTRPDYVVCITIIPFSSDLVDILAILQTWNKLALKTKFVRTDFHRLLGISLRPGLDTNIKHIKLDNWTLTEDRLFFEKQIASHLNPRAQVSVPECAMVILTVWFQIFNFDGAISEITFDNIPYNIHKTPTSLFILGSGEGKAIFQWETAQARVAVKSNADLQFSFDSGEGYSVEIQLPLIDVSYNYFERIEFRPDEFARLFEEISFEQSSLKSFCIKGEGGIGKSHFIENLARKAKNENSFTCIRHSVNPEGNSYFFVNLIWEILLPHIYGAGGALRGRSFAIEIIAVYLESICEPYNEIGIDEIKQLLNPSPDSDLGSENLIFLAAKVLAASPIRTLIHLKDCHKLTLGAISTMNSFFQILEDSGWGSNLFIFEYRNPGTKKNTWFEKFWLDHSERNLGQTMEYKLSPLTISQIVNGLSVIGSNTERQVVATYLHKKTGGNPFFITQLLQYFIGENLLKPANQEGGIILVDSILFENNLNSIPPKIDLFLRNRILSYVEEKKQSSNLDIFIRFLAIAAILGPSIDENFILRNIEDHLDQWEVVKYELIAEGFLKYNWNTSEILFAHDLMCVALAQTLGGTHEFRIEALKILQNIDENKPEEIIAAGKLYFHLGNLGLATRYLDLGYTETKEIYPVARECLNLLEHIFSISEGPSERKVLQQIEVKFQLAWNEFQSGSVLGSISHYEEILERLGQAQLKAELTPDLIRTFEFQATHNILTIYVELLDLDKATHKLIEELKLVSDGKQLLHAMNRLVLIGSRSGIPEFGYLGARVGILLANEVDDDQMWSVLLSDIGHLYLQTLPNYSMELWVRGVELAVSERQRLHSSINVWIGGMYLGVGFKEDDLMFSISERDLTYRGIEIQIARYYLIKGILAASIRNFDNALFQLKKGLRVATRAELTTQRWHALNNLALVYLGKGDNENASKMLIEAFLCVKKLIPFQSKISEIYDLEFRVLETFKRVHIENQKATRHIITIPDQPPQFSGTLKYLAYNLCQFAIENNSVKEHSVDLSEWLEETRNNKFDLNKTLGDNSPLKFSWQSREYIFAIE
jgi:tetratricopeptide (TPR) repeat protein